jgi:predicted phosphoadenosine phosphosulfate sulfurtransferase
MRVSFSLRATFFGDGKRRPWVAEITGPDERYGYRRRFLRPARDWSESDRKGRDVRLWYALRDGRLYEVQEHVKAHELRRYFAATRGGTVAEIPKDELDAELARREGVRKRPLGKDVYAAARERVAWAFDTFPRVCVSFSGGKDSTVMLHLAAEEARRRRRQFGLLFIDLEAQYRLTIEHVARCYADHADCAEPHWVALPLALRNAVSVFEPKWQCWDPDARAAWVREPHPLSVTDPAAYPFFRRGMEFEEFVPAFGRWYGGGQLTACLVGIRADESLNRFRTLMMRGKTRFEGRSWTTWTGGPTWNVYPLYDWRTEDLWTYTAREKKPYNRLYDRMHAAGLTIHQMRICQPYGDDQRKGLWLYQVIEPETWGRVVARVSGANSGSLYCQESGNVQGRLRVALPEGHTWRSFAALLLESMPPPLREHFQAKIDAFLGWWQKKFGLDVPAIPDEADPKLEAARKAPSWRRVVKTILKNDYWCKTLSFSQHKSASYQRYLEVKKRKATCNGEQV